MFLRKKIQKFNENKQYLLEIINWKTSQVLNQFFFKIVIKYKIYLEYETFGIQITLDIQLYKMTLYLKKKRKPWQKLMKLTALLATWGGGGRGGMESTYAHPIHKWGRENTKNKIERGQRKQLKSRWGC